MAATDGLAPGEEVVLRVHPHGKTLVRPAGTLLLIIAAALAAVIFLPQNTTDLWSIRLVIGAAALGAAIVWFGVPFLKWRTTTYEMTNRRLRLREGILSRTGRDFPLNRISDVSYKQGLVDRMFGCGQLIVESPGEQGELILSEIPYVRHVQGILFQLVEDEAVRAGRSDSPGY